MNLFAMAYALRPYQQHAVNAVIRYFRQSADPAVVVLPTGAGKSLVISELARRARGRVLVLAHVKELVEQNHDKYAAYGLRASIFSAGLGRKEADEPVVFGSVQSVSRNLTSFQDNRFTLLIIDECHRVSQEKEASYHKVIRHLQTLNPALKILGLTATPYRLGMGWLYQYHIPDQQRAALRTEAPRLFKNCIFELPLSFMIQQGYLTPPRVVDAPVAFYDFSRLHPDASGRYREGELNRLLQSRGRVTGQIMAQVVQEAATRQGVMVFAATVAHAREIHAGLPQGEAGLVTGDTPVPERNRIIQAFKARRLKYLVNVSVLTTGFDAPHVDLIAILRPTESVSLYQQIVGRGLRLSPGKTDCLVLDFAGNPFNLFSPEVGSPRPDSSAIPVTVPCPVCGFDNSFWGIVDADGDLQEHYGRRCQGLSEYEGQRRQCDFRYRFKSCDQCGAENDIAARQCHDCGRVLVDPDTRLREALNLKNSLVIRCAAMTMEACPDAQGRARIQITYHDEDGTELKEFFRLDTPAQQGAFYHHFGRQALINRGESFRAVSVAAVIAQAKKFRKPDFVIALRQRGQRYWQIREKLFDYQGRYRQAEQAD